MFCYASTGNVYQPSLGPLAEISPLRRDDPYALSKVTADCPGLFKPHMPVVAVRLFGLFGPGQQKMLPFSLLEKVRSNQPITLEPTADENGEPEGLTISFSYVEDTACCLQQLAHVAQATASSLPAVLNIAGVEPISVRRFAATIGSILGIRPQFVRAPTVRKLNLIANVDLMQSLLRPSFLPFAEAMQRTYAARSGKPMSCNHPNVLLVAFHYPPEICRSSPGRDLEEFLVRQGCRVTILTPQPITQGRHGASVLHVPLPRHLRRTCGSGSQPAQRRSLLRTFVRQWVLFPDVVVGWAVLAARAAIRANAASPFDLVITSSPPESMHWIGWRLRRRGCRWLADFRDGWLLEPIRPEVNLFGRHWLEGRMEATVLHRATGSPPTLEPSPRTLPAGIPTRPPASTPCRQAFSPVICRGLSQFSPQRKWDCPL